MKDMRPFNELEMDIYHTLFLDFSILGGMPAVVKDYIEKGTFEGSLDTQRQLIADYKEDIRKYADSAECVVPREAWPYPSYGDLLFKI